MSVISNSRIYYINSFNRSSGDDGNFTHEVKIHEQDKFTHAVIIAANIPLSFYNVRNGINSFTLIEDDQEVTITLTEGNYNYLTFRTNIIALLNANSPHGWKYGMGFSSTVAKYSFTVTGNPSEKQPSITVYNHLSRQFGFTRGKHDFVGNKAISDLIINFMPENTVYIYSDIISSEDGILQEMYNNNTVPYSTMVYKLNTEPKAYAKKLRTNNSHIYNFTIYDEENNIMNMNGMNVMITLLLYREDNINELFKHFLKLQALQLPDSNPTEEVKQDNIEN
jgi:hypothetical protein